jgi:hypothetical protein
MMAVENGAVRKNQHRLTILWLIDRFQELLVGPVQDLVCGFGDVVTS